MDNSKDPIYEIAVLLTQKYIIFYQDQFNETNSLTFPFFSKNMRKINGLRATLLYNAFQKKKCEHVVNNMINVVMKQIPSYTETITCGRKQCRNMSKRIFPLLCVDNAVFKGNMANLEKAILSNFPESISCMKCGRSMTVNRNFGGHLFVDVTP